jgi:glutamate formiminotransferase
VTTLLAVPNVSEGCDPAKIDAIATAFDARLLDVHSDPDHNRSVFTLAAEPGALAPHVVAGAREAMALIDLGGQRGEHPRVGAIDVAPIVYVDASERGAACAEALVLADMLGAELGLPVFLYGELARGRTRATLRRGGPE